MSTWLDWCKRELELASDGEPSTDGDEEYWQMVKDAVLELCEVFSKQGHSGMSASFVSSIFHRLTQWQPLTPLTGEDDEWAMTIGGSLQNKRCPSVFKDEKGAYQHDYYIFEAEDGTRYTTRESRKNITFPYVPGHEIVRSTGNAQEEG